MESKREAIWRGYAGRDAGFTRLGRPAPGEWLYHFYEPGQTLEEFVAEGPAEAAGKRIRIRAVGRVPAAAAPVLAAVREHLALFWEVEAVEESPLEADPAWRRPGSAQWDADRILERLSAGTGPVDLAVVGFAAEDLGRGRLPFVFGLGSRDLQAAVFSIARFGEPARSPGEDSRIVRRALGVSAHEAGHVLGLSHCIFYACLMNGSNTLEEADRRPVRLCPLCEDKARRVVPFDPAARLRRLAAFYQAVGLAAEADACRAVLSRPGPRDDESVKPPPR